MMRNGECYLLHNLELSHKRDRIWIVAHYNGKRRRLQQINQNIEAKANLNDNGPKESLADANGSHGKRNELSKRILEGYPKLGIDGWWEVEPKVGRVADGVSAELDIIGRIENEDTNNPETITEKQITIWRILHYVWENREIAKTSPDVYRTGLYNCVPEMSCSNSYGGWFVGSRLEKDKGLRDLWKNFYSEAFNKAQDLLPKLLERTRAFERSQKMASKRIDRLRCLGNAVVPQIVEWIGRQILSKNIDEMMEDL